MRISLWLLAVVAYSANGADLPHLSRKNFKAFRDAVVSQRCVNKGLLSAETAIPAAYQRMRNLDRSGAEFISVNRGLMAAYLGDELSEQLENNLLALDIMDVKRRNTTCRFTYLRNLAGGIDPSVDDALRAAP